MKSIIVDLGSSSIKLGFNNEENPKFELPSYIGETYEQIVDGKIIKNENKKYISSSCYELIYYLKLYYPIRHGYFTNPDDINTIFDYLFKKLGLNTTQDISTNNILITEPLFGYIKNKKKYFRNFIRKNEHSFYFFRSSTFLIFPWNRKDNRNSSRKWGYDDSNMCHYRRVSNPKNFFEI